MSYGILKIKAPVRLDFLGQPKDNHRYATILVIPFLQTKDYKHKIFLICERI